MSILLAITIALLITFVSARITAHFKYPPIMGQFIASLFSGSFHPGQPPFPFRTERHYPQKSDPMVKVIY